MEHVTKKAGRFFDSKERLPFGGRQQVGWVEDVIAKQPHQRNVTKERIKHFSQRLLLAKGGKWCTIGRLKVVGGLPEGPQTLTFDRSENLFSFTDELIGRPEINHPIGFDGT